MIPYDLTKAEATIAELNAELTNVRRVLLSVADMVYTRYEILAHLAETKNVRLAHPTPAQEPQVREGAD